MKKQKTNQLSEQVVDLEILGFDEELDRTSEEAADQLEKLYKERTPEDYRDSEVKFNFIDLTQYVKSSEKIWEDPPYDPVEWSLKFEYNTRLKSGIKKKARALVGNRWKVNIKNEESLSKNKLKKAKIQKQKIEALLNRPNTINENFHDILYKFIVDKISTGIGYLEVIRNVFGDISQIRHCKSINTRFRSKVKEQKPPYGFVYLEVNDNKRKFIQSARSDDLIKNKVFLKEFGDKRGLNRKTGKFSPAPDYKKKEESTEIIYMNEYAPGIEKYGVPEAVSAKFAIDGNYLTGLQNISFLGNDATPRMMMIIKNGKLETKELNRINYFLEVSGRGVTNKGRVLILQPKNKHQGLPNNLVRDVDIKIEKLGLGITEDSSFTRYRNDNNKEIAEALEIPELYFNSGDTGGKAAAGTLEKLFLDTVVFPEIQNVNRKLNETIVYDILAERKEISIESSLEKSDSYKDCINNIIESVIEEDDSWIYKGVGENDTGLTAVFENEVLVELVLVAPEANDDLIQARVFRLLHELGSLTANDVNKIREQPLVNEPWANRPFAVNKLLLENGADPNIVLGDKYNFKMVEEENKEENTQTQPEREKEDE